MKYSLVCNCLKLNLGLQFGINFKKLLLESLKNITLGEFSIVTRLPSNGLHLRVIFVIYMDYDYYSFTESCACLNF